MENSIHYARKQTHGPIVCEKQYTLYSREGEQRFSKRSLEATAAESPNILWSHAYIKLKMNLFPC